jgi:hypothetical protein
MSQIDQSTVRSADGSVQGSWPIDGLKQDPRLLPNDVSTNAGDKGAEQTRARNANHPNLQPPSSTHYAAPKTSANQSE